MERAGSKGSKQRSFSRETIIYSRKSKKDQKNYYPATRSDLATANLNIEILDNILSLPKLSPISNDRAESELPLGNTGTFSKNHLDINLTQSFTKRVGTLPTNRSRSKLEAVEKQMLEQNKELIKNHQNMVCERLRRNYTPDSRSLDNQQDANHTLDETEQNILNHLENKPVNSFDI